jgi:hypothetical protein
MRPNGSGGTMTFRLTERTRCFVCEGPYGTELAGGKDKNLTNGPASDDARRCD